jgi:hypothetical protein
MKHVQSLRVATLVAVVASLAYAQAGCATVIKGTSQAVTINTIPPGADVYVDNQPVGRAPVTVSLTHADHTVSAQMPGYGTGFARLTSSFSGWALFFFPAGTIIDAITGAITTLDQDAVTIQLGAGGPPQASPQLAPPQPAAPQPAPTPTRNPY